MQWDHKMVNSHSFAHKIQNLKSGWINGIGNQTHLKFSTSL